MTSDIVFALSDWGTLERERCSGLCLQAILKAVTRAKAAENASISVETTYSSRERNHGLCFGSTDVWCNFSDV